MPWTNEDARGKFSALLNTADTEGPQLIRRGKQCFVLVTEEELERRFAEGKDRACGKFLSAWDVLRVPPHVRLNAEQAAAFDRAMDRGRQRLRPLPEL